MKDFKFTSLKNVRENWHIFEPKIALLKEKLEYKQQEVLLKSFKPGGNLLTGLFTQETKTKSITTDLSPAFIKYLNAMTERFTSVK